MKSFTYLTLLPLFATLATFGFAAPVRILPIGAKLPGSRVGVPAKTLPIERPLDARASGDDEPLFAAGKKIGGVAPGLAIPVAIPRALNPSEVDEIFTPEELKTLFGLREGAERWVALYFVSLYLTAHTTAIQT
jgi:hypothetical protein